MTFDILKAFPDTLHTDELARLLGKPHEDVVRDIDAMLEALRYDPADENVLHDADAHGKPAYVLSTLVAVLFLATQSRDLLTLMQQRLDIQDTQLAASRDGKKASEAAIAKARWSAKVQALRERVYAALECPELR